MCLLRGGAYGANSIIKVATATEDHVGSQPWPSACGAVKYGTYNESCGHQRFTVIDYKHSMILLLLTQSGPIISANDCII